MLRKINFLSTINNVLVILLFANVCFSVPNDYDPESVLPEPRYKESELIVRFAQKASGAQLSLAERDSIVANLGGGAVKRTYKLVPGLSVVKLPPGLTVQDAVGRFNKAAGILYAEPNYRVKALSTFPNDPCFPYLWGMHNTGQTGGTTDADIDAPEAWDIITDVNTMIDPNGVNKDIIIAVIDSGIDSNHPDLEANLWINEAELNREFS